MTKKENPGFVGSTLLSQSDIVVERVELPKPYTGHVFVKTMTGEEWDAYQETIVDEDKKGVRRLNLKSSKAKLLARCVCDEAGNLVFAEGDIPLLAKKSNRLLEHLTRVAQRLNGLVEDDEKN